MVLNNAAPLYPLNEDLSIIVDDKLSTSRGMSHEDAVAAQAALHALNGAIKSSTTACQLSGELPWL